MPAIYENLIIGVDGREGGLDAAEADSVADGLRAAAMQCEADLVVVGASRRAGIPHVTRDEDAVAAAVARWQERHLEAGACGAC